MRSYLDAHEPGIAAVGTLLAEAERRGNRSVARAASTNSAHLFALETLDHVLIAEALAQSSRAATPAERALLASWILNASLSDRLGIVGATRMVAT